MSAREKTLRPKCGNNNVNRVGNFCSTFIEKSVVARHVHIETMLSRAFSPLSALCMNRAKLIEHSFFAQKTDTAYPYQINHLAPLTGSCGKKGDAPRQRHGRPPCTSCTAHSGQKRSVHPINTQEGTESKKPVGTNTYRIPSREPCKKFYEQRHPLYG